MMRIGFLPSDFNPMVLMLGEAEDCRALGVVLRRFAGDGKDVALAELEFCHARNADVLLTAAPGPVGMHQGQGRAFIWRVAPGLAVSFADRLDNLAAAERVAGSEDLDSGTEDGIGVKVSRGEYTDDFLNGDRRT